MFSKHVFIGVASPPITNPLWWPRPTGL